MLSQGSTLIIDDKKEDGQPISDQLRELCIPHLFIHADEERIFRLQKEQPAPINKVRVIFQDINLTGGSSPSRTDYSYASTVIDSLLSCDNGPWLMVTWSTWSGDEENQFPQELFNFLREDLEDGKKPYHFVVLDKSKYTTTKHGTVKAFDQMDPGLKENLALSTTEIVTASPAMSALMAWEKEVGIAVSNTLANLHSLSGIDDDHDQKLGKLIFDLAKAEAGKGLSPENSLPALTRILNNQLIDRISINPIDGLDITEYSSTPGWSDAKEWKRRINQMLHVSIGAESPGPGSIYLYSSYLDYKSHTIEPIALPDGNIVTVEHKDVAPETSELSRTFHSLIKNENLTDTTLFESLTKCIENAEWVLVDITPPCDHAQLKAEWAKFVAGFIVDIKHLSAKQIKSFDKIFKSPDFLWNSCDFSVKKDDSATSHKRVILNSRVIITIPAELMNIANLTQASATKLKEQITRDLTHWLGKQLSRPGYTSM